MAELWIIPSWVYSRQHMHVSMRSHYKAKGIRRNNMLFAWLQKLQQPLPALPADGSSVHCLHFSTCEERQKPSSRGQILTGEDVSSERTSLNNSNANKRIWKYLKVNRTRPWTVLYGLFHATVTQHFRANFRHLILIKTFSSPLQHLIKPPVTNISIFFHVWNETWKFNETYCLDIFLDKNGSFPGKIWWKDFVLTKSNKKPVSTSSCYSALYSMLEWIQT